MFFEVLICGGFRNEMPENVILLLVLLINNVRYDTCGTVIFV